MELCCEDVISEIEKQTKQKTSHKVIVIAAIGVLLIAAVIVPVGIFLWSEVKDQTLVTSRISDLAFDKSEQCLKNMQLLGQAVLIYAEDHQGNYPPSLIALKGEYLTPDIYYLLVCPSDRTKERDENYTSYAYCLAGVNLNQRMTELKSYRIMLYEKKSYHKGYRNICCIDTHTEKIRESELIWRMSEDASLRRKDGWPDMPKDH
jgi:hypothetical protein